MTRACVAIAVVVAYLACMAWLAAEAPTYTLAVGVVEATDQEQGECYWTIDTGAHATVLIFHPKNMSCARMRELKGKSIRLQAVVE